MIPSKPARSSDLRLENCHGLAAAACLPPAWVSDISSGVPAMDRLHHDLFSTLDALSRSDDESFCANFGGFVGNVERVFREEEAWMDDLDFPAMSTHQEQHARVLGALHHIHAQVMAGDVGLGRHVTDELLPQWLQLHISTMDTPLALAMQLARGERELFIQAS